MSKLIIDDLNFFESELINKSAVKGGLAIALATDLDTSLSVGFHIAGTQAAWNKASAVAAGTASAVSINGPATAQVSVKARTR